MLNLNMYSMEELSSMKKTELMECVIKAQNKANDEYTRAIFWEKDSRVETLKVTALEEEVKDNEDNRIADIMAVRGQWEKSENKLVASLNASDIYGEQQADKLEVALHSLNEAEEQSAYWEDAWGKAVEEHLRDEVVMQGKVIDLQARIINSLD